MQDQLHNLQNLVQNENAALLVLKRLRILGWPQQSIKPREGPSERRALSSCPGHTPKKPGFPDAAQAKQSPGGVGKGAPSGRETWEQSRRALGPP